MTHTPTPPDQQKLFDQITKMLLAIGHFQRAVETMPQLPDALLDISKHLAPVKTQLWRALLEVEQ